MESLENNTQAMSGKGFIDTTKPKVYLTQGMRGGGKSAFDERVAQTLYDAGWLILDLLGARNLENLYWVVNKNHELEFQEKVKKGEAHKGDMHCSCNKDYPISVLVPNYVKFDQDTIDTFNKKYWTKEEWIKECKRTGERVGGIIEWSYGFQKRVDGKLVENDAKPPIRTPFEKFKICPLTPPTATGTNKELITNEFYDIVEQARKERRIVCFNPMLFPNEFHRYKTLEIIIRSLEQLSYRRFKPPTPEVIGKLRGYDFPVPPEGIPKKRIKKWTKREHNYDKVCVLMREFGEVTANILKGENQSTLTKKALLQYIRQTRHYRISLVGDYQRPDDVFPSIREQADYFIIKKAPEKLLGDGWSWLFKDIAEKQKAVFEKYGKTPATMRYVNKKMPQINNLKQNQCYVVYTDNSYRLYTTSTPAFHHKQELEHFENDTGIKWIEGEFNARMAKNANKSENKVAEDAEKDLWETKVFGIITSQIGDARPKWDSILSHLAQLKEQKVIDFPDSWTSKDAVRKWFGRYEKRTKKK
jgi:hypothetical protein